MPKGKSPEAESAMRMQKRQERGMDEAEQNKNAAIHAIAGRKKSDISYL